MNQHNNTETQEQADVVISTGKSVFNRKWIHNVTIGDYKIGPNGYRVFDLNNPYKDGRLYNLPVPGWDVGERDIQNRIMYYSDATFYLKDTEGTAVKMTCRVSSTLSAGEESTWDTMVLQSEDGAVFVTLWTAQTGLNGYLRDILIMVVSDSEPWPGALPGGGSTISGLFAEMAHTITTAFSSLMALREPDRPGLYLTKTNLPLYLYHDGTWEIGVDNPRHRKGMTYEQLTNKLPDSEFPLQYRGGTLWD